MRSFKKYFGVVLLATALFTSCGENNDNDMDNLDTSVIINGVKWATCNVDAPGTFATTPESTGMFYQWNRKIGWSSADTMLNSNGGTEWDNTFDYSTDWATANDPSPAGWRMPTVAELTTLIDTTKVNNEWIVLNGVNGRNFTDKISGNSLFLPAGGVRHTDGALSLDPFGFYWSSMNNEVGKMAKLLLISSDKIIVCDGGVGESAFSVRCVAK